MQLNSIFNLLFATPDLLWLFGFQLNHVFGYESCFSYTTQYSKSSLEASMITKHTKASLFIYSFLHAYTHSLNIYWTYLLYAKKIYWQADPYFTKLNNWLRGTKTKQIKKKKLDPPHEKHTTD